MLRLVCSAIVSIITLIHVTQACESGQARLTGFSSPSAGSLEVCISSAWRRVVDTSKNWTLQDSFVACKMLGYDNALKVDIPFQRYHHQYNGTQCMTGTPGCFGVENNIFDCSGSVSSTECGFHDDIILLCNNPNHGDMRIVGSGDDTKGIVEVYDMTYKWSTVCSNEWGDHDANVVCKYLGYDSGEKSKTSYSSPLLSHARFDGFECNGDEANLLECSHNGPYPEGCRTSLASVECKITEECIIHLLIILSLASILALNIIIFTIALIVMCYSQYKRNKKQPRLLEDISTRQSRNSFSLTHNEWTYVPLPPPPTYSDACSSNDNHVTDNENHVTDNDNHVTDNENHVTDTNYLTDESTSNANSNVINSETAI